MYTVRRTMSWFHWPELTCPLFHYLLTIEDLQCTIHALYRHMIIIPAELDLATLKSVPEDMVCHSLPNSWSHLLQYEFIKIRLVAMQCVLDGCALFSVQHWRAGNSYRAWENFILFILSPTLVLVTLVPRPSHLFNVQHWKGGRA